MCVFAVLPAALAKNPAYVVNRSRLERRILTTLNADARLKAHCELLGLLGVPPLPSEQIEILVQRAYDVGLKELDEGELRSLFMSVSSMQMLRSMLCERRPLVFCVLDDEIQARHWRKEYKDYTERVKRNFRRIEKLVQLAKRKK